MSAAAGWLASAALLALLLTQSAALIHAIAHTTPLSSAQSAQGGDDDRWGHEINTLPCVALDHLLASQHIGSDAGSPQRVPASFWLAPQPTGADPRSALLRHYQARGPPAA